MALDLNRENEIFGLRIDETSKSYLLETMRWAKFAGIIFTVLIMLVSILMIFLVTVLLPEYMDTPMPNALPALMFTLLFGIGINFYPIFALLRFSSLIKKALHNSNQQQFNHALKYMKNLFRYMGVLTIVMIVLYGVGNVFSFLSRQQ